jgi:hypothetical protein
LIDSTIAFTAAFGLEALLFSDEIWTRLPVGIVLAMMILLISWCVGTTFEAKTDFSALSILSDFTRMLRGRARESGPNAGDGGGDDGQNTSGALGRAGAFREALNRYWRQRRRRASVASTLVDSTGSNGACVSPGGRGVEMSGMNGAQRV